MAGKLANYIEYQRRHLPAEQFSAWAAQSPRVQTYLAKQEKLPAAVQALENLRRDVLKQVMVPGLERASRFLTYVEKGALPASRTGALRQAIGSTKARLYASSLTAWIASGPRRGYGRLILARMKTKGVKLVRTSKKFTDEHRGQISTYADPVKYAHFLITGRKQSVAGQGRKHAKSLMDPFTGRFFGHSVKAAAPRDFMAPAEASASSAANIAGEEMQIQLDKYLSQ